MLGNVKRPYKKRLEAENVWLMLCDYRLVAYRGQIVTVTQHNGPFRTIRTADGQEFYGLGHALLQPVKG